MYIGEFVIRAMAFGMLWVHATAGRISADLILA
jgi:hypothetical protein